MASPLLGVVFERHGFLEDWRDLLGVWAALVWTGLYALIALRGAAGFDSHAYWLTRGGIDYRIDPGQHDAYLYSPAFAQAIRPLTLLPWYMFAAVWMALAVATYLLLGRAIPSRWQLPVLALCVGDVVYGNVWWLFAIVVVYGLRQPVLWAIPLLVKVTPAVGLVWFAVRREWRSLFIAIGAAAVISAVSFAIAPEAWWNWIHLLSHGRASEAPDQPLLRSIRLLFAILLTAYAARRDRPRLLPIALLLATPVLSLNGIGILLTVWQFPDRRRADESSYSLAAGMPRHVLSSR